MQEILSQPWAKFAIGAAVLLFFISKYVPLGNLLGIGKKKSKFQYAFVSELMALVKSFKNKDFTAVESNFDSLDDSYRSFGINALGEIDDSSIINQWLQNEPEAPLPLLVKGAQTISKAWKIRGTGTVDSVSSADLATFKNALQEAKNTLLKAKKESNDYTNNINEKLLQLYKAIDVNREEIHSTFNESFSNNKEDIGVHINYFVAISEKWGGTKEELEAYFKKMPNDDLLKSIINTMLYNDQIWFYLPSLSAEDKKAWKQKVRVFIKEVDQLEVDETNLFKYELYRLMATLAYNVGGLDSLGEKYENQCVFYSSI